jgi:hypothetical protein
MLRSHVQPGNDNRITLLLCGDHSGNDSAISRYSEVDIGTLDLLG